MEEGIEKALDNFRAKRIVFYKHTKGKEIEDVDFVEHKDVVVLITAAGTYHVLDGEKMIVYPHERFYESEWSGEPMRVAIRQSLVMIKDQERQLDQIEKFREPGIQ